MAKRFRILCAWVFPLTMLEWINQQRCSVSLENYPGNGWKVKIGTLIPCIGTTLRSALAAAVADADEYPEWRWK